MNELEVAWVAGFLEGEGSFVLVAQTKPLMDGTPAWRIDVTVVSTDLDVLEKLQAITQMGRLYRCHRADGKDYLGKKPQHRWMTSKRAQVTELLTAIRPHMGQRRGVKIDELLSHIEKNPYRPPIRAHLRQVG